MAIGYSSLKKYSLPFQNQTIAVKLNVICPSVGSGVVCRGMEEILSGRERKRKLIELRWKEPSNGKNED